MLVLLLLLLLVVINPNICALHSTNNYCKTVGWLRKPVTRKFGRRQQIRYALFMSYRVCFGRASLLTQIPYFTSHFTAEQQQPLSLYFLERGELSIILLLQHTAHYYYSSRSLPLLEVDLRSMICDYHNYYKIYNKKSVTDKFLIVSYV